MQLSSRRVDRRARIFEICSQSHTASRGVLSAGMDQGTAGGARHDGWCQSFLVENVSDALSMETRSSMMVFYPIHVICEADSVAALRFIMVHHASGVGIVESGADRLWVKDGCVGADRVNLSHVCFRSIHWLDASTRTAHLDPSLDAEKPASCKHPAAPATAPYLSARAATAQAHTCVARDSNL